MQPQPHTVELFTEVATKYEFLNTLMTAGRDRHWRENLLQISEAALGKKPEVALDLATGTGDIPRMMAARWSNIKIIGTDPTPAMLNVAKEKSVKEKAPRSYSNIEWQEGVAENLNMADASVDLVTIAFGFRNVKDEYRSRAIAEAYRVLRPGGVYAILELGTPRARASQSAYRFLLKFGMPTVAGLFAPKDPYKYLAQSILDFPPPENVKRMLTKAGFLAFAPRPLSFGMCWLYVGKKSFAS
jgi:demethylmenaquinone methyltransferase/2-methoxy-6-polyprenyl-1,4-benzoquinol methylase